MIGAIDHVKMLESETMMLKTCMVNQHVRDTNRNWASGIRALITGFEDLFKLLDKMLVRRYSEELSIAFNHLQRANRGINLPHCQEFANLSHVIVNKCSTPTNL